MPPARGDGGAQDRPDRGWARTIEEGAGAVVLAQALEAAAAEQDEREAQG